MTPAQAQVSITNLNTEIQSLNPSALITLFELDLSDVIFNSAVLSDSEKIFRFHSELKLINTDIFWQGDRYIAAPIVASGFELTTKGSTPTPKLTMVSNDEAIDIFATLRQKIRELGDIVGARVTRIRTFAKYLDYNNFPNPTSRPKEFAPDPYSEFPRDIYYVERKSQENKTVIEYELTSIFDVQGIKLPGRVVSSQRCMWTYRGAGCNNEYEDPSNTFRQRATAIHEGATLPVYAPAVGTVNDEFIFGQVINAPNLVVPVDKGAWNSDSVYSVGDQVYIQIQLVKYYYVYRYSTSSSGIAPPNSIYWVADECSKTVQGCRMRFGFGAYLPFGGFPGANRNL